MLDIKLPLSTSTKPKQLIKEILANAIIVQLVLEILSHRSLVKGLVTPLHNPIMFLCSVAIISAFVSLGLFLPKRHLGYMLADALWLWLGIVNFILLGSRTTPLTAMDFKMLTSVFTVIGRYLNTFQLALFFIALVAVIALLIFIGTKLPRTKWKPLQGIISLAMSVALMIGSFNWAIATGNVSTNFGNIANAYIDYGFAYSFATSVVDRGIKRPDSYSTDIVSEVIRSMNVIAAEAPEKTPTVEPEQETAETTEFRQGIPNIIIIQLESFFDAKRIKALNLTEDPIPNMTALRENYSSGYLTVPSIGAGTINTEFEILTGMSLDYFGAGEYPYKTILSKSTVESYAYDLSEIGYHCQAIHDNMGTFYSRNTVYPKLGFDGFTSIEYMKDVEYNQLGWAKDTILIPEIMKTLGATDGQDFIYTVSVQPHGKYPDYPIIDNPEIDIYATSAIPPMNNADSSNSDMTDTTASSVVASSEPSMKEATYYKYLYYVNQIHEEDAFVGELIKTLEEYPEPVVVVFYGDHLPTLDITEEDLSDGTPFQTEYVMWDNMGLQRIQKDYMAYQLGSMVMERLGYYNGLINKYHQKMQNSPDYESELEILQYDMLYGNKDAYDGMNPYAKKKMIMGVDPITISDVKLQGEAIFVTGENFTRWSEVYFNNNQKDTIFLDEHTLIVPGTELMDGTKIKVSQVTDTGRKLSSTSTFTIGDSDDLFEEPYTRTSGYVR